MQVYFPRISPVMSHETPNSLGQCSNNTENFSSLTDNSLEYLHLLHLSITSNELSFEEGTIETSLDVYPCHLQREFNSEVPENHIGGEGRGVNVVTY